MKTKSKFLLQNNRKFLKIIINNKKNIINFTQYISYIY